MQTFTDSQGRPWSLVITISTVRRVRELVGVDLMQIAGGELLNRLSDPVTLVDVLWAVCKPQADVKGINSEAFGEAMLGDAIEAATNALLAELVSFFPSQTRIMLQRILDAAKKQQALSVALVTARLDAMSNLGESSPSAPPSPGSNPTP